MNDMKTLLVNDESISPDSFIGTRAQFESAWADSLAAWYREYLVTRYDSDDEEVVQRRDEFVEMVLDDALSVATDDEIDYYPKVIK